MKRTKINRTKQFQDVIKFELIKFLRSRKIRAALILTAIVPLLIYLLTNFLPLLPSGSFFNDFNSTLFWINLSIMYACNKKTNFFQKK